MQYTHHFSQFHLFLFYKASYFIFPGSFFFMELTFYYLFYQLFKLKKFYTSDSTLKQINFIPLLVWCLLRFGSFFCNFIQKYLCIHITEHREEIVLCKVSLCEFKFNTTGNDSPIIIILQRRKILRESVFFLMQTSHIHHTGYFNRTNHHYFYLNEDFSFFLWLM